MSRAKIIGFFEGRGSYAICAQCIDMAKEAKFFNLDEPVEEGEWSPESVDCDRCGKHLLDAGTLAAI